MNYTIYFARITKIYSINELNDYFLKNNKLNTYENPMIFEDHRRDISKYLTKRFGLIKDLLNENWLLYKASFTLNYELDLFESLDKDKIILHKLHETNISYEKVDINLIKKVLLLL